MSHYKAPETGTSTLPRVYDPLVTAVQRALLERLLDLTDRQAAALHSVDLEHLIALSELRASAVRDAASSIPPRMAWVAEVADLVALLQQRSAALQDSIRVSMAAVQRDLADLTKRERMTRYLTVAPTSINSTWEG